MKRFLLPLLAAAALCLPGAAHAQMVNAQTGTTYTFLNSDCDPSARKVVTFSNASAIAVTLPQAGGSLGFPSGYVITAVNLGVGIVTITPGTSTINGVTTLVLPSKSSATIFNDSTPTAAGNYVANIGSSQMYGHVSTGGPTTAPALTSCGTTPAITGTDTAGIVTMGTTATGCVITFNQPYTGTPYCVVSWIATPLASQSYVTSATAITTTQTSTSNNKLQYVCIAPAGG